MPETNQTKIVVMGLIGAAIGGAIGHFAFLWITRQGFYALVLPGGLLGIGAGVCARGRSVPLAVICGIGALALGLFSQWRFAPFFADPSLGYFLAHVSLLTPVTLFMIVVGAVLGFVIALGKSKPEQKAPGGND